MKTRITATLIVLSIAFSFVGCLEISKLKKKSFDLGKGVRGLGVYEKGEFISFVFEENDSYLGFGKWTIKTGEFNLWNVKKTGSSIVNEEYIHSIGTFNPDHWIEGVGIAGFVWWSENINISSEEFRKETKDLINSLLEKGINPVEAMKTIAVELDLITKGTI